METVAKIYLYKDDPKRDWNGTGLSADGGRFVYLVQGEGGSEGLEFHLMLDSRTPLDLTGASVGFYMTKPDGKQIFTTADVPAGKAALGVALVGLSTQCTAASGIAKYGEIRVTGSDGGVIKFPAPDICISASETEAAIESQPEFQALDAALSKAETTLSDSQSALASALEVLNSDRQAVAEASAAASDAGQKAQAADTAASFAISAAESANAAAQHASASAQAASDAAQNADSAAAAIPSATAAQIDAQKDAAGGIASYDIFQSHRTDLNNPHGVTALQVGVCNRNLLTDGNIQVWQESESFSGLTGNRYTATMWQTWQSTGAAYDVQKAGDLGGIVVTNRSSSAIEVALVALVEKGTMKPNAAYTVTLKGVRNGSALTFYVADYGKAAFASKVLTESDSSFTFTTPASLENHFYVAVSIGNLAAGAQAEIDAVKLEEGAQFTGFSPEQYADVFARTQRYYQRHLEMRGANLASSSTGLLYIPLYCCMRSAPTVTVISGADQTNSIGNQWNSDITPQNLRAFSSFAGGFLLAFDNAENGMIYMLKSDVIQADARM